MTRNYNRSNILNYFELTEMQQNEVISDFCIEPQQAEEDIFVISKFKDKETVLPLSLFIRTNKNNFTHGIYSDSYFSCYCLTLSKCNSEAVIAYKYF